MPLRVVLPILMLLSVACSSRSGRGSPDSGTDLQGDGGTSPGEAIFRPADAPEGPALLLAGEVDALTVRLRVVGSDLGPVFGLSYHLRWDPSAALEEAPVQEDVLSTGDDALMRTAVEAQGVSLGGTRVDPLQGDVDLSGSQDLASLTLEAAEPGRIEIAIERPMLRRSDGTFVTLTTAGGTAEVVAP